MKDLENILCPKIVGSGIMLTNNRKKDVKIISSLENGWILLKRTTKKNNSQEGGSLNLFTQLMSSGLPLIKYVLTTLAKGVLMPLRLTAVASATDVAIQKKTFGSEMTT